MYNILVILLIASEKLITLDMNLQFAICNFFQTVRQNLLYVSVLQQGLGRKIANCKLQIAISLVQTHPIEAISTKWLTV